MFFCHHGEAISLCSCFPSLPEDLATIVKVEVTGSGSAATWKLQLSSIELAECNILTTWIGSGIPIQGLVVAIEDLEFVVARI